MQNKLQMIILDEQTSSRDVPKRTWTTEISNSFNANKNTNSSIEYYTNKYVICAVLLKMNSRSIAFTTMFSDPGGVTSVMSSCPLLDLATVSVSPEIVRD